MNFKNGIQTKHTVVIDLIPSILTNIMIIHITCHITMHIIRIPSPNHSSTSWNIDTLWDPMCSNSQFFECAPPGGCLRNHHVITDTKKPTYWLTKPANIHGFLTLWVDVPMFAGWLGLSQMGTAPKITTLLVMMTNHVILASSYWIWQIPWYSMVNFRRVHAREEYETRMLVRCCSHTFQVSVRIDGYWCIKLINDYQIIRIPLINGDKTMDCYQIEMADYNLLFFDYEWGRWWLINVDYILYF
jgi:hypothetical protein